MLFQTAVAIIDWCGVIVFTISGRACGVAKANGHRRFRVAGNGNRHRRRNNSVVLLWSNAYLVSARRAYLVACVAVSCIVFFTAHIPQSRYQFLLWFDALGLGLFAVVGAEKALLMGTGPTVAVAMGVITATFGGVLRDLLGAESPVVLSREIYVTAALAGAASFVAGSAVGLKSRGRRHRGSAHWFWTSRSRHSAWLVIASLQIPLSLPRGPNRSRR